jgi:hypothetical protein
MSNFFKGWRRKFGLLTLMLALAFMGAWVRSMRVEDILKIPSPEGFRFSFTSEHERISWHKMTGPESERSAKRVTQWKWLSGPIDPHSGIDPTNTSDDKFYHFEHDWKWDLCGFYFAEGHGKLTGPCPSSRLRLYVIPFGSITMPLTLLSAYLLLSKTSSTSKSKKDVADLSSSGVVEAATTHLDKI